MFCGSGSVSAVDRAPSDIPARSRRQQNHYSTALATMLTQATMKAAAAARTCVMRSSKSMGAASSRCMSCTSDGRHLTASDRHSAGAPTPAPSDDPCVTMLACVVRVSVQLGRSRRTRSAAHAWVLWVWVTWAPALRTTCWTAATKSWCTTVRRIGDWLVGLDSFGRALWLACDHVSCMGLRDAGVGSLTVSCRCVGCAASRVCCHRRVAGCRQGVCRHVCSRRCQPGGLPECVCGHTRASCVRGLCRGGGWAAADSQRTPNLGVLLASTAMPRELAHRTFSSSCTVPW